MPNFFDFENAEIENISWGEYFAISYCSKSVFFMMNDFDTAMTSFYCAVAIAFEPKFVCVS